MVLGGGSNRPLLVLQRHLVMVFIARAAISCHMKICGVAKLLLAGHVGVSFCVDEDTIPHRHIMSTTD